MIKYPKKTSSQKSNENEPQTEPLRFQKERNQTTYILDDYMIFKWT